MRYRVTFVSFPFYGLAYKRLLLLVRKVFLNIHVFYMTIYRAKCLDPFLFVIYTCTGNKVYNYCSDYRLIETYGRYSPVVGF